MEKQFYTVKEVAKMLGLSEMTIYRMLAKNRIPSYKFGGSRLFKKDEIEQWIAGHKVSNK